uniref:Secretagogin, EF-hand calcium binding protein n=1 Tax=Paramormyrops kingsleyae TaxID=1676925 RepID=A0A3B3QTD7_9TELE
MDSAFHNLDAALFMDIWRHFDRDDKGYVDRKMLEDFFRHTMKKLGVRVTEEKVQQMKHRFASTCDGGGHERLQIQELASKMLPEDENFLLLFRREEALESSVEFMRIWRNYDTDSSGYISAVELKDFLKDLFLQHNKVVSPGQLEKYTEAMMKMFDKNNDGRLDLNDLASLEHLLHGLGIWEKTQQNSVLHTHKEHFPACFAAYSCVPTICMLIIPQANISSVDLDKFRHVLLEHCDVNRDGKIQKNELALCLGLKLNS